MIIKSKQTRKVPFSSEETFAEQNTPHISQGKYSLMDPNVPFLEGLWGRAFPRHWKDACEASSPRWAPPLLHLGRIFLSLPQTWVLTLRLSAFCLRDSPPRISLQSGNGYKLTHPDSCMHAHTRACTHAHTCRHTHIVHTHMSAHTHTHECVHARHQSCFSSIPQPGET